MGFYDTYATYPEEDIFQSTRFEYTDVKTVYHISARYNEFGERLEFGSYVLELDDGRLIDLYAICSEEFQKENLVPLFWNAAIIELDSDRDLPVVMKS